MVTEPEEPFVAEELEGESEPNLDELLRKSAGTPYTGFLDHLVRTGRTFDCGD